MCGIDQHSASLFIVAKLKSALESYTWTRSPTLTLGTHALELNICFLWSASMMDCKCVLYQKVSARVKWVSKSFDVRGCGDSGGLVLESGCKAMPNSISWGNALSAGRTWLLIV